MKNGFTGGKSKLSKGTLRRLMAMVLALMLLMPSNLVTVLSAYAEETSVEKTQAAEEEAAKKKAEEEAAAKKKAEEEAAAKKKAEEEAAAKKKAEEEAAAKKAAEEEAAKKAEEEKKAAEEAARKAEEEAAKKAAEEEAAKKAEEEAAKKAAEEEAAKKAEEEKKAAEEAAAKEAEQEKAAEEEAEKPAPAEEPTEEREEPTEVGDDEAEKPSEEKPADEPTEAPADEPTEAPAEEEPADEPTEAPAEAATEEPTVEPTEEPTPEPTEEPVELTLDNFAASATEVFPGETIEFTYETTGAERVEFAIYNGSDTVASGEADGAFSWTPDEAGSYLASVTAIQGAESITRSISITVKPDYSDVKVTFSAVDGEGNGVGGLVDVALARGDYDLKNNAPSAVESEKKYEYVKTQLDGETVERLSYSDADRAWLITVKGETRPLTGDAALTVYYKEAFTDRVYDYDDRYIHAVVTLSRASAVPDDADLVVTPITGGRSYDAYMTALNDHTEEEYTGENTLLYDFAFMVKELDPETGLPTGKTVEIKPENNSMKVEVTFKKNQISKVAGEEATAEDVSVVHLPLKDSVLDGVDATVDATNINANDIKAVDTIADSKTDVNLDGSTDNVEFKVNSFSVFAFTVDFHYNGVDYSIPGMSQILLSELIVKLNIMNGDDLLDVKDVKSVEFSDERLVTVEQVSGIITYNNEVGVDVGEKDFLLTSEEPFTSDETLTITLLDGTVIEVGVTDAPEGVMVMDSDGYFTHEGLKYCNRLDDLGGIICYGYAEDGGYPSNITIPASFSVMYDGDETVQEDIPVVKLSGTAFRNDNHVNSVVFEGNIQFDGGWWDDDADAPFYHSSIESVTFKGSTTTLCAGAFANSALRKVDAGAVKSRFTIGDWAFQGTKLDPNDESHAFIAWDQEHTTIGSQIFYDTSFTEDDIYYVNGPATTDYDDGKYTYKLYEKDGQLTAKITGLSKSYEEKDGTYALSIPNSVEAYGKTYTVNVIGSKAFYENDKIKSVSIDSDTGIAIGENAFAGCDNMTGTVNGVTSIGTYAFYFSAISSVTMQGTPDIGNEAFNYNIGGGVDLTIKGDNLTIPYGAAYSNGIKSLTIDSTGSLSFEDYALYGFGEDNAVEGWPSLLESITIKAGSDINLNASQVLGNHKNSRLKTITVYPHVKNLSDEAFDGLGSGSNAVKVEFMGGVSYVGDGTFSNFNGGKGSVIRIHNNVKDTKYDEGSFPTTPNVKIVFDDFTIDNSPIHDDALYYEKDSDGNLIVAGRYDDESGKELATTFTVPKTVEWEGKTYNVVAIKEGAFKGLSGLNVTVEGDIDVRGVYTSDSACNGAFSNTRNITVTFKGANTTLGSAAFMKGNGVTIVSNGTGTFDIGRKSFYDCKNLNLTVNGGNIPIGVTYGSDGWNGNSFQNATGELTLLGTIPNVQGGSFYASQITKVTTLAVNGNKLSDMNSGWESVDFILQAEPNDSISFNAWSKAKSLTVNYADKVDMVFISSDLGNNGAVPVIINFNGGVGEVYGFTNLKGAEGSQINIKGDSAKVYDGSFPDDTNLTVNFDMYYEDVTGANYNDELTQTTVNYKAHDYRKAGKEQILLSDLIKNMGLTMEDGSEIDLADVASVQFQGHTVDTPQKVSGLILYNVTGETPVNVGAADYVLTSDTAFTDEEAICITLNDGTKITSEKWVKQADKYNIDGRDSIKLTDILKATGNMKVFEKLGYTSTQPYASYGNYYYIMWRVVDKDNNTIKQGYDLFTDYYNNCEITSLNKIDYPGYAKLYIKQYGAESDGWVTFNSDFNYIWLIQNKKPVVDEAVGPFIYKVENGEAVITGVNPDYTGDGDVTVPATVELEDYDTEKAGVKKTYTVSKIKKMALSGDEKLTKITLADSGTPLLLEDSSFYQTKNLTSVSGDRPVKFQKGTGNAFDQNVALASVSLHIDDNRVSFNQNDALKDVELYFENAVNFNSDSLKGLPKVENLKLSSSSITLGTSAFAVNDALVTLEVDSENPTAIGAYALKDKTALTTVTIPGGVTSIGDGAFSGDTALKTVALGKDGDNAGQAVTIEKGAFTGCTALEDNKVTCEQIVKSEDGTATIAASEEGTPLGAYLVVAEAEENETLKTEADKWYKEQGNYYPIEEAVYRDISLVTPAGKTVEGVAVDIEMCNLVSNHIELTADGGNIDPDSLEVFHLADAEAGTVEHIEKTRGELIGNSIANLNFHVDSLSPFALTVLGNKYHDDMFWYEVTITGNKADCRATIIGVYDGDPENPVTELEFTGKTHDANEFVVLGIQKGMLNGLDENEKTAEQIAANNGVKSIVFTDEGIKALLKKDYSGYHVIEDMFSGLTGLESVVFGDSEDTGLGAQLRFDMRAFYGDSALKSVTVHANKAYVHSTSFGGCNGIETVIFTGTASNNPYISNSAFVDASGIKYLRIDHLNTYVQASSFMAANGTAFVTKDSMYDNIANRIGKFDTYIFLGDHTGNIYPGAMKGTSAPSKAYIANPVAGQASVSAYTGYEGLIKSAGSNLKDIYFNCERSFFGEDADVLDAAAAAKGITLHYTVNDVAVPFYLDGVSGNDETGDGTFEAPYKTFGKLAEAIAAVKPEDEAVPEADTVIAPIVDPALAAVGIDDKCATFTDQISREKKAYIKNTVTISSAETWSSDGEAIELYRYPGDNKNGPFTGVMVQNNSTLTLGNVVLDGGGEPAKTDSEGTTSEKTNASGETTYVTATAPIINSTGTLNIGDGAVLRNNNRTSFGYPDKAGGIYASGTVNMTGGEISGNTGTYGGGIQICGSSSVFNMSGGVIENNVANGSISYGGGVNVGSGATMNLSGGTVQNNKATGSSSAVGGQGGGIALGADVSGMCQNARLAMSGGTVTGNESAQSGGGIFIQTNCTANITAGYITNNTAHGGAYGGGGIYANGVRDDTEDGRLYLNNVLITDNSADETGGGYAGCCTSTAYIYMGNGAAIFSNSAGDDSDIHIGTEYHVTSWGMQSGTPFAYVSQFMFNGTAYNWKDVENDKDLTPDVLAKINMDMSMRAYPDGELPTTAAVVITGNHSATKGGGIGSDGFVSIGDKPSPMDVKWTPSATKTIYGRDMKEGEEYTFSIYEEKTSQGQNFWWTRYNDVELEAKGRITGGKDGVAKAIEFDEIDLGEYTADGIGSTRTFLVIEDFDSLSDDVYAPRKYFTFEVIIGSTKDENGKNILNAETRKIRVGNIVDGHPAYSDTLYGKKSDNATWNNNYGRIRSEVDEATFSNYATKADVQASKIWTKLGKTVYPVGGKVVLELYADGKATGRQITLDGSFEDLDTDNDGEMDKDGEVKDWVAQWTGVPVYRTDGNGQMYKARDYDDDYVRIEYSVAEIDCQPSYYTAKEADFGLTDTTQTVVYNQPSTIYYKWVTYELYADGEPTGKTATLDLTKDKSKFPEEWYISWPGLPVYHTNAQGKLYKDDPTDTDYSRIVYTVVQIDQEEAHHYSDSAKPPFDPEVIQQPSTVIPLTAFNRKVTFTNVCDEGDLKISKSVISDYPADENQEFEFTVKLSDTTLNHTFDTVVFEDGVATVKVKANDSLTITGLPQGVTYTVEESTVDGFDLTESTGTKGEIGEDTAEAAFTNTRKTGERTVDDSVTVNKVGVVEGVRSNLSGATFTLYADKALKEEDEIKTYTDQSFAIDTEDKDLAGFLPVVGETKTYYLVETAAPEGYKLDETPREVTIKATLTYALEDYVYMAITTYDVKIDGSDTTVTAVNEPITDEATNPASVTLTKADAGDENVKLTGAVFTLYDGTTAIDNYTTTADGTLTISTQDTKLKSFLPTANGETKTFTLKETKAPAGYELVSKDYNVTVAASVRSDWNSGHTRYVTTTTYAMRIGGENAVVVMNPPITGEDTAHDSVTVTKVSADSATTKLKNAVFTLYDGTTKIDEYKTNANGVLTISTKDEKLASYLPEVGGDPVTLTLKETKAPEGYLLAEGSYTLKLSAKQKDPEWKTVNGEKKLVTTIAYTMTIDGKDAVVVTNPPITGEDTAHDSVTVTKVSADSATTKLKNAVFTLYDGTTKIDEYKTNANGVLTISTKDEKLASYLPEVGGDPVTLTLKETKAPEGYLLAEGSYTLELSAKQEDPEWKTVNGEKKLVTTTAYTMTIDGEAALTVANPREKVTVTVTKSFSGVQNLPTNFKITNDYNSDEFTVSNATGKGTEKDPYLWTIEDVPTGTKITFKESGETNSSYDLSTKVTPTGGAVTATAGGANRVSFTNTYSATPSPTPYTPSYNNPTPTPVPMTEVTGAKVWDDEKNAHKIRPSDVTITLLANGEPVDASITWTKKTGDRWTFTFGELPEVDENGDAITYTVRENAVEYYTAKVSGTTVTNTLDKREPKDYVNLSGTKTWRDDDNAAGIRPTSITVRLLRDGDEVQKITVTAGTNWQYDFGRLPADDGYGHVYTYTLHEDAVEGYYTRIKGMDVTNGLLEPKPNTPEEPPEDDRDTATPRPPFEGMTDEELEDLFDLFGYGTPLMGMMGTGDEIPAWVWGCGGVGLLALALALVLGKRKKTRT